MKIRQKKNPKLSREAGRDEYQHFTWHRVAMPMVFLALFLP